MFSLGWISKKREVVAMDEIHITRQNTRLFFDNYVKKRLPVLIKNGIAGWPLMHKWTNEYFVERFGSYPCSVVHDSRSGNDGQQNIPTTWADYFANHPGKSAFVFEPYNTHLSPPYLQDIELPNLFFGEQDVARYLVFHAHKDGGALPHTHGLDTYNFLPVGIKEWIMFDADEKKARKGLKLMQEYEKKYSIGAHSKTWFENEVATITQKTYPVYRCMQMLGDVVYIPTHFCHAVLNHAESLGIAIEVNK